MRYRVKKLKTVVSTNGYLQENASRFANPTAVYTLWQTGGRGRLDRRWAPTQGKGLACSVLCFPRAPLQLVPLAVEDALRTQVGLRAAIKWPNDILCGGRKICGILFKKAGDTCVCGMGINLRQTQADLEAAGLPPATSVLLKGGRIVIVRALVRRLTKNLLTYLDLAAADQSKFLRTYQSRCVTKGGRMRTHWSAGRGKAVHRFPSPPAHGSNKIKKGAASACGPLRLAAALLCCLCVLPAGCAPAPAQPGGGETSGQAEAAHTTSVAYCATDSLDPYKALSKSNRLLCSLLYVGQVVAVYGREEKKEEEGMAVGIAPDGALLVDFPDGRRSVYAADVSIRTLES